jgi:hypothetical protein
LDAQRAIAWRAADSFALREFLGLVLPESPPDVNHLRLAMGTSMGGMHRWMWAARYPEFADA